MCDDGDFFDDGIGPEQLGIFLGISEELAEEEAAKQLEKDNDPLTFEEMVQNPLDDIGESDAD